MDKTMTDNMVDMKLTPKERKKHNGDMAAPVPSEPSGPEYPWGLEVRLEDEALTKMGVDLSDYQIGDDVELYAKCKVIRLSQSQSTSKDKNRTLELQITDLCLEPGESDAEEDDNEDLDWTDSKQTADRKLKKRGY